MAEWLTDLLSIDESDLESGKQERDGDARPHSASADDPDRLDLRRRDGGAGDPERRALGEEEVPPCTGLLRLDQLFVALKKDFGFVFRLTAGGGCGCARGGISRLRWYESTQVASFCDFL